MKTFEQTGKESKKVIAKEIVMKTFEQTGKESFNPYVLNDHNFNRTTKWCIIDDNTTKARTSNIAHTCEIIISCWNWFQSHEKINSRDCLSCLTIPMDSNFTDCGFYFGNLTIWKMIEPLKQKDGWISLFIQHMNCVLSDLHPSRQDVTWHRPDISLRFDDFKIAEKLQNRILRSVSNFYNNSFDLDETTLITRRRKHSFRIGLIDRKGSRIIQNMKNIQKEMEYLYPSGHYEMVCMEDLSPVEQWLFWASKDIILVAHGQAEANAIFLRANSSIIEIFPPHYYPQFYGTLFDSIGIHHFPYFNEIPNWIEDHSEHSKTIQNRSFYRGVKFMNPNVSSIMVLFEQALNITHASL
jgi:hypothetical protein